MAKKPSYEFKNLTQPQQNCLTLIESLGIYELRALARIFGDNSPTILKRDDHIKIIMNKIISGEDLKSLPMRAGRPHKELSNIEGILAEISEITGKEYTSKPQVRTASHPQKFVTFRQVEEDIYQQKLFPIEISGVILERNQRDLFLIDLNNKKTVLIKREEFEDLKPYDFITGSAVMMNKEQEYILESVKTVNYKNYKTYQDEQNPYETTVPNETLKFEDKELLLGSRYIFQTPNFIENAKEITSLLKKLNENKTVTLALVPNVMPEDVKPLKSIGFNTIFMTKYDDSPLAVYETLNNFIQLALRLQGQGLKLALFVQDIPTLANSVDYVYKSSTKALMGHTETAVDVVKQLMLLAKAGGKDKHTTLFTTMDQVDLSDPIFVSAVYKISKRL